MYKLTIFSLVNVATSIDHTLLTKVILADTQNLNDDPVKTSLKDTEEKEQLQTEQDLEPDTVPQPAGEINLHKD